MSGRDGSGWIGIGAVGGSRDSGTEVETMGERIYLYRVSYRINAGDGDGRGEKDGVVRWR